MNRQVHCNAFLRLTYEGKANFDILSVGTSGFFLLQDKPAEAKDGSHMLNLTTMPVPLVKPQSRLTEEVPQFVPLILIFRLNKYCWTSSQKRTSCLVMRIRGGFLPLILHACFLLRSRRSQRRVSRLPLIWLQAELLVLLRYALSRSFA